MDRNCIKFPYIRSKQSRSTFPLSLSLYSHSFFPIKREALDSLTVTDSQRWYDEHIIAPTRRQLIIIVCSTEEKNRNPAGIILNNPISQDNRDNQRSRYSMRSSFGMPSERLLRLIRRQEFSEEDDEEGRISMLKSKSDSKIRCLTTKRSHSNYLRSTKSETLHLNQPLEYPQHTAKIDYIIKSFEFIEINDEHHRNQYRKSLKISVDSNWNQSNKSFISIKNLKQFKESCLLYNINSIQ